LDLKDVLAKILSRKFFVLKRIEETDLDSSLHHSSAREENHNNSEAFQRKRNMKEAVEVPSKDFTPSRIPVRPNKSRSSFSPREPFDANPKWRKTIVQRQISFLQHNKTRMT